MRNRTLLFLELIGAQEPLRGRGPQKGGFEILVGSQPNLAGGLILIKIMILPIFTMIGTSGREVWAKK